METKLVSWWSLLLCGVMLSALQLRAAGPSLCISPSLNCTWIHHVCILLGSASAEVGPGSPCPSPLCPELGLA
jgi:hypothetical protein